MILIKMKKYILLILFLLLICFSSIFPQQPFKIAIHFSNATEIIEPDKLLEKITYWELLFINNKIKYDVIYDTDLESGLSAEDYHTIIFPYTRALSNTCYNSVVKYLDRGGSIVAFGEFGIYDEKSNYIGLDRLESLFGVIHSGNISEKDMSSYLDLIEYPPLTNNISKKSDIQITAKNSPVLVEAISQNTISIGKIKTEAGKNEYDRSFIVLKTNPQSKLLWFSFDPTEVIGGREDSKSIEQIIKNAIVWFSGGDIN